VTPREKLHRLADELGGAEIEAVLVRLERERAAAREWGHGQRRWMRSRTPGSCATRVRRSAKSWLELEDEGRRPAVVLQEVQRGREQRRPRVKLASRDELLAAAGRE